MNRYAIALFGLFFVIDGAQAQEIRLDGTTDSALSSTNTNDFLITGESTGNNLFHSFEQFSIPLNSSATFITSPEIENVFNRVTGSQVSSIDGILSIAGSNANLFLLNPNGITFGANASLSIGGSFLATTADRFVFENDKFFSATDANTDTLLTVSSPVGLVFGNTPGDIINRANSTIFDIPVGLNVQANQNLSLIGGDILIEQGFITAPGGFSVLFDSGGQINLGSVISDDFVSLDSDLIPIYSAVQKFGDISILDGSIVSTNGVGSGAIHIQAKRILIDNSSAIEAINTGDFPGDEIVLRGTELISLTNGSSINSQTLFNGNAGNVLIRTPNLILDGESFIDANAQEFGSGNGGNIDIETTNITLSNTSRITTETFGAGNAGEIDIAGSILTVESDGLISTQGITGNAGTIALNLNDLLVLNNGAISATSGSAEFPGNGGNILINAGTIAALTDSQNRITANAFTGDGGNIDIVTEALFGSRFLEISASSMFGLEGQIDLTEELNRTQQLEPTRTDIQPIPTPRQGCPAPGGEASFRTSDIQPAFTEAQALIAKADGTIAFVHDPSVELQQIAQKYEDQGKLNEAKAVYKSLLLSGNKSPEIYAKLLNLLFHMEPSQENLQDILDIHGKQRLTQLEDLVNCGDITLASIYEVEDTADSIITIIELEDTLNVIVSSRDENTYSHNLAVRIPLAEIAVPLNILSSALRANNLFDLRPDIILESTEKLYNAIFTELEYFLPDKGVLLFVLDGLLQNVSMSLFRDPSGEYLIEKYAMAQTTIPYVYQDRPQHRSVLAAGLSVEAPSFNLLQTASPGPLPFVDAELELFEQLPIKHSLLENEAFTVEKLLEKGEQHSILHIATYGQFSSNPKQTFLIAYDRLITIEDFQKLVDREGSNNSDSLELLVLSACTTAQGDDNASLGLAGIAVRSGAESTIASLWPIDDKVTSEWMQVFYESWLTKGMSKVEAVREAQLAMLKKYPDPRFFAPLILSGNLL